MRYRIHGRDGASQSAVEPFVLDVPDEEEARNRASELGTVVDRVELLLPEGAATASLTAPAAPALAGKSLWAEVTSSAPSTDAPRPPRRGKLLWLLVVAAALILGVGLGMLVPRIRFLGSPSGTAAAPPGIRVEEVTTAEKLFSIVGQEAIVLKYSGGDVEFWVELESEGKTQKFEAGDPAMMAQIDKPASPEDSIEGYFIWIRRDKNPTGTELWTVAQQRDSVSNQSSGVELSNVLMQATVSQTQGHTQSGSVSASMVIPVWHGKKPQGTGAGTTTSIPNPLPTDRALCLKEMHEEKAQDRTALPTLAASTPALMGSPLAGPVLAATALMPGRVDDTKDAHTIRVMCKAASAKAPAGKEEPAAK
jgi:hypothetical protein